MRRRGDPPARHAREAQLHACAQGAGLASSPSPVDAAHADALCRPARVHTQARPTEPHTYDCTRKRVWLQVSPPPGSCCRQPFLRPPWRRLGQSGWGPVGTFHGSPGPMGAPSHWVSVNGMLSGFQEPPVGLCGRGSRWLSPLRVCPDPEVGAPTLGLATPRPDPASGALQHQGCLVIPQSKGLAGPPPCTPRSMAFSPGRAGPCVPWPRAAG